jgi:hypothetical protein
MKNKLLYTSALVGSLALSSFAQAEISGHLKYGYAAGEGKNAATPGVQGYNREVQIDMSTKGELDNGVKFSAGASLEQDGGETRFYGNEGNYFQLSFDSTDVLFGLDKAPNLDDDAVPMAGTSIVTVVHAAGADANLERNPSSPYGSFGVAVTQKTAFGDISLNYVPQQGDTDGAADHTGQAIEGQSAYELKFKGNLGVEGLKVVAGINQRKFDSDSNTGLRDGEGSVIGASYNFGSVAVGMSKMKDDTTTAATTEESTIMGVTFAASDKVTVGLAHGKHEINSSTEKDEKTKMLQVGYNLGPIVLELNYVDIENQSGSDGKDVSAASVFTTFKF